MLVVQPTAGSICYQYNPFTF